MRMGALSCRRRSESRQSVTDPVTGLSKRDIALIRKSWKTLETKGLTIPMGAELFILLLEEYPYMLSYFQRFHLKNAEMRTNHLLGKHALTFMNGIALYVDYIDAPDPLVGLLQKVALNHIERDISKAEMDLMAKHFVMVLQRQLGNDCDDACAQAWLKFFVFLNEVYMNVELQVHGIHAKKFKT